ncbi:IPT/TIG domain-containing protein [Actinoplanes utahensis]|uniref:IPT/TIG domain-containing protein n=1 Tax=Actinoplanes utahensis TaxID=1869 RepID=A0A0A6URR5_ACTUT|nr:IPT/TIG domain-containing protein [Actinoplanes utahensis]KHD78131.1 hypothetical protein MB27_06595 [Actinoplanes utahensis]GIF30616.1 hypothetical protein Aut01nite_36020 [Actinoplanes utahensis]
MNLSKPAASLACAATTALVLTGTAVPARAAALNMTLTKPYGLSGGGNMVVGTVPATAANANTFAEGVVPQVQFQFGPCTSTAKSPVQIASNAGAVTAGILTVDPADITRVSGTKIAFRVPSSSYPALDGQGAPSAINTTGLVLAAGQTTGKWSVCAYSGVSPTGPLLATSTYNVVTKPTIVSATPTSSPAGGGQTITVTGTGFTAVTMPVTATIGGTPVTNIKLASDGRSFTAVTGPRAPQSNLTMTISTPGGPVHSTDPDNNSGTADPAILFDYSNGINVAPDNGRPGKKVTLDITGAGFSQLNFVNGSAPTSADPHVFLVDGAYNMGSNRGVAECEDVVVVTDNELVCNLDLAADALDPSNSSPTGNPIPHDAYVVTVVDNGATNAGGNGNPSIVSSGATFTVGPY